jgi:hypothetical protein
MEGKRLSFAAVRKFCDPTNKEVHTMFPEDHFPPLPEEPKRLPLWPSDMSYVITVYYDSTRNFRDDDLERIWAETQAQYPGRKVCLESLNPLSLQYVSLSPFPEMEQRFKGKPGYVSDVEGRLFPSGSRHYTEFVKRNLAALQAHAMAMSTLLHANPQGLITPPEPDDDLRKKAVYRAMGPIIGNKTFHREDGQPDRPIVYPLVEHEGMLLGCTDFTKQRRIHWAREMTPAKAIEHGERRYAREMLFGISTEETKRQILFEAKNARPIFTPELLDPTQAASVTEPIMILAWYSQAIAALRKVCWLVATKQEASIAAQALYDESLVHKKVIGNPRLPRNRRSWEQLIGDLTDARTELIAEQCRPILAVNEMTYRISWQDEILAALMGTTYDSQVDCPDSPFDNPSKYIRHLADWIGELKRKRTATLNAYTADSIIEMWDRPAGTERLLLSQFPRATWDALAEVSAAVSHGARPDVEISYTWSTNPLQPFGYEDMGHQIALEGPLLCYPALEADHWRKKAQIIRGLGGFEL